MTTPFDLEREDLLILLDNYNVRLVEKSALVARLRQELTEQEEGLKNLEDRVKKITLQLEPTPDQNGGTFPINGTWHDKIKWVLEVFNRPLTTTEIVDILVKYMPSWDRKKLMTSVSATVSASLNTIYTRENEKVWIK